MKLTLNSIIANLDALPHAARNLGLRTISTTGLASWINRTIGALAGSESRNTEQKLLADAKLAACESIALIEALEQEEGYMTEATPPATLDPKTALSLYITASQLANRTALNRYEKAMSLPQWLKFLITNTQRDNSAALQEFAEVSGHDIKDVQFMDQQAKKAELERLDKTIPALIDQFKIDSAEPLESEIPLDVFNYYKLLLKIQLKMQKEAMAATNRALRFTNLAFLEDARAYKEAGQVFEDLANQFLREHEETLALYEREIQNLMMAA